MPISIDTTSAETYNLYTCKRQVKMHLARKTILHLLEIIGLDESSPLINKLRDEKIEKEELKKYNSSNSRKKFHPNVVAVILLLFLLVVVSVEKFHQG